MTGTDKFDNGKLNQGKKDAPLLQEIQKTSREPQKIDYLIKGGVGKSCGVMWYKKSK